VDGADELQFRHIGRYEVIRKIATGGMAELFLARFVGPGGFEKRCALKRILPQFAADRTFTKMFLTEARVTAMFDHPNLVQIFELGQDENAQFYIAMELVNGMNLRQLLHMVREKGAMMPPELAAYMMSQALDGLAYAHEFKDETGRPLHLVHRDVSPQNLLVSYEGAVKVVDFGIVKGSSISGETQAGMLKGKVAYMSPEQASGETIDLRSDLFSIGVCMYELMAGEKPFTGANEIMCLKAILDNDPPPITQYVPDCPEGIEQIIHRALEKRREDRFQSAREFQIELQAVLRDCPVPLGRHVVADYLKSFTEESTATFDSSRLRIPRMHDGSGPRFALSDASVSFGGKKASGSSSKPGIAAVKRSRASIDGPPGSMYTPTGQIEQPSFTMEGTGLTNEMHAAGLVKMNPAIVLVFAASAFLGGLAVWFLTRVDQPVVITEPTQIQAVLPPPKTETPPSPEPTQAVEPPPKTETPPPKTETPPAKTEPAPKSEPPPPRERVRKKHATSEPRVGSTGTLSLTTVPRGLSVQLDERTIGKTPLASASLPVGTHVLKVSSKSLGISKQMTVKIVKGEHATETLTVGKGTLKVMSRPWAEVFVDGQSKGKTPLETAVYEGTHEVRLVSPEAGEQIRKIEMKTGATEDLRVKF
jgi:serine/threonine-protein kinase